MRMIGLVGRSGSGKTTLIASLLPTLRRRGLTVSTIKHAHHGFDLDRPGKDSFVHREAGAKEVMLVSDSRWALMHEIRNAPQPALEDLVARLAPVDLVLIEGFHTHRHAAIEVHRPSEGHDLMWREGSDIIAVASDESLPALAIPVLNLNDTEAIADFVLAKAENYVPARTRMGIGLSRVLFGAGRTRTSLEFMGFDADKRPEGADWPVEAHECPTPEPRAAVNPRVSDREAAARVSEAGLTASTGSGPRRGRTADKAGAGEGPALPWAMFQSTSGKA